MQFVVVGVLIVMAMAGIGGAYKLGEEHAMIAADAKWSNAITQANKERDDAREIIALGLKSTDRMANDRVASLTAALEAKEKEIADAAGKIEISDACRVCRYPGTAADGVQPGGTSKGGDPQRVSRPPAR
jgi:hypothetical protein